MKHEPLVEFRVADMTCEHCIDAVTDAIKAIDPEASVEVSLADHIVRVESDLTTEEVSSAISDAGYTPVAMGVSAY